MNIKVGDRVTLNNSPLYQRDVLYIHQKDDRKFYVVAFKGDIPTSHQEHELNKFPEVVEKVYYLEDKTVYNIGHTGMSHKLIISYLDDEPISVRLEKL